MDDENDLDGEASNIQKAEEECLVSFFSGDEYLNKSCPNFNHFIIIYLLVFIIIIGGGGVVSKNINN